MSFSGSILCKLLSSGFCVSCTVSLSRVNLFLNPLTILIGERCCFSLCKSEEGHPSNDEDRVDSSLCCFCFFLFIHCSRSVSTSVFILFRAICDRPKRRIFRYATASTVISMIASCIRGNVVVLNDSVGRSCFEKNDEVGLNLFF